MGRIIVVAAIASFVCAGLAEAQARAGLERAQQRIAERKEHRVANSLDDCAAVSAQTIDVLRHGFAIVNQEQLLAQHAQNRMLGQAIAGQILGALDVNLPVPGAVGGYRRLAVRAPSREEYRERIVDDFRTAANRGIRVPCSKWAEDLAWAYAPDRGTECAGLPNDLVNALRGSARFYAQDRWRVREQVLAEYRSTDQAVTCDEHAVAMVANARMLDP